MKRQRHLIFQTDANVSLLTYRAVEIRQPPSECDINLVDYRLANSFQLGHEDENRYPLAEINLDNGREAVSSPSAEIK